jgi:chorismate synthase
VSNSFGEHFRITSFGESHGQCVGIIIDGCPSGLALEVEDIQIEVNKRRPAAEAGQTARAEEDKVEILSGVFQGYTTGAPIGFLIRNKDIKSAEYEKLRFLPRPGHADYTASSKYGGFNDYRGGGRFSGRTTVGLVMAGAVAKKLLKLAGIEVLAHTVQIGGIKASVSNPDEIRRRVYSSPLRCADEAAATEMSQLIEQVGKEGDSVGGVIEGLAMNMPVGLGDPYFDSLESHLAKALFAIPAVKGVEFGAGFSVAEKRGSVNNDPFALKDEKVVTVTNNAGGSLGGITTGMPVVVKVAVKPTPSISRKQLTVDMKKMENAEISINGRHDVCIVPRAVIVVEAMMAVALCDFALGEGLIKRIIKWA